MKTVLEQRRRAREPIGGLRNPSWFTKVLIATGHMIDAPDRKDAVPHERESVVREQIAARLEMGTSARATSPSAARAARTSLASSPPRWAPKSGCCSASKTVPRAIRAPADSDGNNATDLRSRRVKTFLQPDRFKAAPKGASVFARNNLWMVNTARVEVSDPKNLYALLVWDEKPAGDGPGERPIAPRG